MKRFSQRKGLNPVGEVIQIDSMNSELRSSLWNALDVKVWSSVSLSFTIGGGIEPFSKALWFHFFKKPIDSRPGYTHLILIEIRGYFFGCKWFEVYDFLEFVVGYYKEYGTNLGMFLNGILEQELSGYRFVSGHLTDITNAQELEMLETALADSRFAGVDAHLQQALNLVRQPQKS